MKMIKSKFINVHAINKAVALQFFFFENSKSLHKTEKKVSVMIVVVFKMFAYNFTLKEIKKDICILCNFFKIHFTSFKNQNKSG